jgi:endoribonuclease Dicer
MDLGTCNLLIATKSTEDLDIPKVSIVIRSVVPVQVLPLYPNAFHSRFDLFESQVSYAYTRACARGRESYLVHMLERENGTHRRIISQNAQLDGGMQEWANTLCRSKESSVPPKTLREITDPYHSDSSDEPDDFIEDPTTRGRIYSQDATAVIYRFSANLRNSASQETSRPLFEYEEKRGGRGASRAYCTIVLPGTPIHDISGSHIFSIAHARRAACYKACSELYKKGFLDYWLFPLPSGTTSRKEQRGRDIHSTVDRTTERNSALMGAESKAVMGTRLYPRKQPYFWTTLGSTTSLYPTVISTDCSHTSFQPCASMLILTPRPLPPFGDFNIFLSGVPATIHLQQCAELRIDQTRLDELHKYTLRISRTLANKSLTCPLHDMACFFAPLSPAWKDIQISRWQPPSLIDHIPWHLVSIAAQAWATPLQSDENDTLATDIDDAVIQENRTEFTRRYDAVTLRTDLTPLSKVFDTSVRRYLWVFWPGLILDDAQREASFENILASYKAHRKAFPDLKDNGQPIIQVSRMPPVWNRLDPTSRSFAVHQKAPPRCEPTSNSASSYSH